VLAVDDATGMGVLDDVALPVTFAHRLDDELASASTSAAKANA